MNRDSIITKEDLEVITKIADKYNFSLADLGKVLCRKKMSYPRFQISCNEIEYETIKSRADKYNLSMSKYCLCCFEKAIKTENIEDINFLEIFEELRKSKKEKKAGDKGRQRINVCLRSNEDYLKAKEIAKKLDIPLALFVRYVALTTNL